MDECEVIRLSYSKPPEYRLPDPDFIPTLDFVPLTVCDRCWSRFRQRGRKTRLCPRCTLAGHD